MLLLSGLKKNNKKWLFSEKRDFRKFSKTKVKVKFPTCNCYCPHSSIQIIIPYSSLNSWIPQKSGKQVCNFFDICSSKCKCFNICKASYHPVTRQSLSWNPDFFYIWKKTNFHKIQLLCSKGQAPQLTGNNQKDSIFHGNELIVNGTDMSENIYGSKTCLSGYMFQQLDDR